MNMFWVIHWKYFLELHTYLQNYLDQGRAACLAPQTITLGFLQEKSNDITMADVIYKI